LDGGSSFTVCPGICVAQWTPDGKSFCVIKNTTAGIETLVVPVSPAGIPLSWPSAGITSTADMHNIPGAKVTEGAILWGPRPDLSATLHQDVHRNLYRVPLE
jgi:hypothetical protein